MTQSMAGLKRSMLCGQPTEKDIEKIVTLMGWCHNRRDLGSVIFLTLCDRSGEVQLTVDPTCCDAVRDSALSIKSEYVVACVGRIRRREAPNDKMKTGTIEIVPDELRILSVSKTPPFYIEEQSDVNDTLRLTYRYLDLRRPDMQQTLMTRHKVTQCARDFFDENGFLEIETPMLGKSTPEGARDYLVPSRVKPGSFFALPQSPQLYKQLLMLAGYDRYMQVTKCFRDEDLRADRQPEFTQIDLEMAFVDCDDVMKVVEGFIQRVYKKVLGVDLVTPFARLTYEDAIKRFGTDKPDLRFGLELCELSDVAATIDFQVFQGALKDGGSVRAINVQGGSCLSRKQIDGLTETAKTYRAGGMAWLVPSDEPRGSFLKFLSPDDIKAIKRKVDAKENDLVLIVCDKKDAIVFDALSAVRLEAARLMGLIDEDKNCFAWVTEFLLFEFDEDEKRYVAKHHPFTAVMDEDMALLETAPEKARAKAYDIILNGTELGGGSIRIHDIAMQEKMFDKLGFTKSEAYEQFGFLLDAFAYGAPPHGGLALGLDRLVMLMTGKKSIRDVIAFPKVQNSSDLMTKAPSPVAQQQLDDLGIMLKESLKDERSQ